MVSKVAKKVSGKAPIAQGVGRRKSAVARVWLRRGNGKLQVNGLDYQAYFDTEHMRQAATTSFRACTLAADCDVTGNVEGSGKNAQADAIKLGMARALVAFDATLRPTLRQAGLLTVDARVKERKKPG